MMMIGCLFVLYFNVLSWRIEGLSLMDGSLLLMLVVIEESKKTRFDAGISKVSRKKKYDVARISFSTNWKRL